VRWRDVVWALLGGRLVATVPLLVHAQQPMPTVGVVSPASSATSRFPGFFLPQLKEFGWEDGRNCRVIFRWAEGRIDRFPALIDELAHSGSMSSSYLANQVFKQPSARPQRSQSSPRPPIWSETSSRPAWPSPVATSRELISLRKSSISNGSIAFRPVPSTSVADEMTQ